jgi:adenine-specific DNA-methyltransferase
MARSKQDKNTTVASIQHADKRTNIPTSELSSFMEDEERVPKTMFYPRDPSLDPQLVWQGKDAQDQADLAVPVVPVYVQEKIEPLALIKGLQSEAAGVDQLDLFADFDGLNDLEQKVDFYHHGVNWANRMILGDSLLVMTSLAQKENLKGQVQMIYLDPPYGIKFGSNWQVSARKRDVKDGKVEDATRQPEQVRAFRDTWQLGIHSYLAYLRDRLVVARELLTETGSVFVQIGDENAHLVRCILDEVFGSDNFVCTIAFAKTTNLGGQYLDESSDYIQWYSRNKSAMKFRRQYDIKNPGQDGAKQYRYLMNVDLGWSEIDVSRGVSDEEILARIFSHDNFTSQTGSSTTVFPFNLYGVTIAAPNKGGWKTNKEGVKRLTAANRLLLIGKTPRFVRFFGDFPIFPLSNRWSDTVISGFGEEKVYVVQTLTKVIQRCLLMTTDPGDLVLDPTCGSGTTAYVAEQWGRRWITVDTSRVALALARTRLMAAKYPYFLLADSPEGTKREAELTGQTPPTYATGGDIRKGFVYKRVPHITLKSIANNTEIDEIHARWQPELDTLRTKLNQAVGKAWEEWEIPRAVDDQWLPAVKETHAAWWRARRDRQQQIDASIQRNAEPQSLFDQPYEDAKRVRVSGRFTMESLSPFRVLPADEDGDGMVSEQEAQNTQDFVTTILENLRAAGVQNTVKGERLKFTRLDPYAGTWLQAEGEYEDASGAVKTVAVSIGPEFGTVSPEQVREAAKEARKGIGFDVLIVCGFAFDPHVSEEARQMGKLTVLPTRANPDLAMGGDLLKKTGAGNLFTVFGEPDIDVQRQPDGKLVVAIKGVDVYDPTTGEIRSNSADDILCWFIDTDYDEESFFVRHAYFTGADDPYERLKRALKAEIDATAWASLYSTHSRPFDPPATGKIAVKVINQYGDEVMKVYGA